MTRAEVNVALVAVLESLYGETLPVAESVVVLGLSGGLGVSTDDAIGVIEVGAMARLWERKYHTLLLTEEGREMYERAQEHSAQGGA